MIRRQLIQVLACASWSLAAGAALAQPASDFPSKPLRIIVPWPAGAATDAATRILADGLAATLGQAVTVDNRPGANGSIGTTAAARAPADGYTLLTATADTHSINPFLMRKLPYDALAGFEPLALFGTIHLVWIARADLPASSMKELVGLAKKKTGQVSYASWGVGSTAHVGGALLEIATGIEMNHVPFAGAGPAINALAGGHVDVMPFSVIGAQGLAKNGKVKVLGIAGPKRDPLLPEVATLAEQGIQDAEASSWYGLMAPAGLPPAVKTRLNDAITKVLANPDIGRKINETGLDFVVLRGAAFDEFLKQQHKRFGNVIQKKGIHLTD